jgi:hypothetical protein
MEVALESFLNANGFDYKKSSSSFILNNCPNSMCRKERHTYVRCSSGRTICFKCGSKWDWKGLVAVLARTDRNRSYSILFGGVGDECSDEWSGDILSEHDVEGVKPDKPISFGIDFIPVEESAEGLNYLSSRNINAQGIVNYDIRWHGTMQAVVFPIVKGGITYGWQARKIAPEPGELRLISSRFNKSRFLLNWDRASKETDLIVVEGPFDSVCSDVVDGVGSVATLGKGVSLDQIEMILQSKAERIYLGLDSDAFEEIYDLANLIGLRKKVLRACVPAGRADFGESLPEEVRESIKTARPMNNPSDYLEVFFK